jgi:monovalent cation:H+ antiporter-2, CPA2 family
MIVFLALLARLAQRWSVSSIPLYLLAGLAFGNGGILPFNLSMDFVRLGAEVGVLMLLFMLGLEYSGEQLRQNLRSGISGGVFDLLLNFSPGLIAGLLLGWNLLPSVLLGGVTCVSSSGIIARILSENGRLNSPETPPLLSILVLEDLVMAIYLPVTAVLIAGGGTLRIVISVTVAVAVTILVLVAAIRYGQHLGSLLMHQPDEIILLSVLGIVLLVSGLMQRLNISAAIGAFLVGIAISGPIAEQSRRLMAPLRDLLAAAFFFFFGLEVDPRSLIPVLVTALVLGVATILTKIVTGYWATRQLQLDRRTRLRAGLTLVAHGEFSIVIAGLGVVLEPRLGPLAAAYVLLLAIAGPIVARMV